MRNATIRSVIVSGALAIIAILLVQSFWLWQTFDHSKKIFDEKVQIALKNTAASVAQVTQVQLPTINLISRVAHNYYVVNIQDAITPADLEYYLTKEFQALSILSDFEYGIYDCDSDEMVYGNYVNMDASTEDDQVANDIELPKHEGYVYYFGVRFPNQLSYMFQEQWLSLIFSLILLVAIGFFIFSTSVILKQKRLSELQKDFINNMTHEFKTPLSSIQIGVTSLLNEKEIQSNPKFFQYLSIIKTQSQKLNQHVERVLQIAKVGRKGFQLNKEQIKLHETIHEVVSGFEENIKARNGTIQTNFDPEPVIIHGDKLHLSNALSNLIDNALKYSKDQPEIQITTQRKNGHVDLSISDSGIGMTEEQLHNAFNQFYRVPTGNVHNTKGFGLGLYYVNEVCKAHQWKLTATSQPGSGTKMSILIP